MTFQVGQKVVCVNVENNPGRTWLRDVPIKGSVYTISGLTSADDGTPALWLVEIENFPHNGAYAAHRFRPLVERKTEVSFTIGADPSSDQFDNRRRVKVGVSA